MIDARDIIIPIPKTKNFTNTVTLNSTDVTTKVFDSEWVKPVTIGIGYFRLVLVNTGATYSDTFAKGQIALFKSDNSGGATQQFKGRIDYVKERIQKSGQFLDLEGRHAAYRAGEVRVGHSATGAEPSQILKDIMDKYLPEFTYTNVQATSVTHTTTWNYKPFWECVRELCQKAGYDAYVDDDLDMHFFPENSIRNDDDAIARDNFIKNEDIGVDDFNEKTRVTVVGQDLNGLPIVYTAKSTTEGTDIREGFIRDTSANSQAQVKDLAEARLVELTDRPKQGVLYSTLLQSVKPGDNIPIILPRQKLYGLFKVLQYKHKFGLKLGVTQTEILIEKETSNTDTILQDRVAGESLLVASDNPNKLEFSFNIGFSDSSQIASDDGQIAVEDGSLKLASGQTTGQAISVIETASSKITKTELRIEGKDLGASTFTLSCKSGVTEFTSDRREHISVDEEHQGTGLRIQVDLASDGVNANPEIKSISVLYS